MYRSREWLYERIRRDRRPDPAVSARAPAQRYRVSRNIVAQATAHPVPLSRKWPPPRVLEPVAGFIDTMLREDLEAPRRQRHAIEEAAENEYRSTGRS